MSWFIMESLVGPGKSGADFLSYSGFHGSWISGSKMTDLPPDPIELTWDPDTEDGIKMAFYPTSVVLMLKDLISVLREAGVDNLDTYPVVIRSKTNSEVCHDYLAVNIIGSVAAADMEQSEIIDEGDGMVDVMFGSLVIDEDKARGHLLFRLAQSAIAVVVHEDVVKHILSKGGFGLTFVEPENFCG